MQNYIPEASVWQADKRGSLCIPEEELWVEGDSVDTVLDSIEKRSINPGHIRLAALLRQVASPKVLQVPVEIRWKEKRKSYVGVYHHRSDRIVIFSNGCTVRTALHEIIHALTSRQIVEYEPNRPFNADQYLVQMRKLRDKGEPRNRWLKPLRSDWVMGQIAEAYLVTVELSGFNELKGSRGKIGHPGSLFSRRITVGMGWPICTSF